MRFLAHAWPGFLTTLVFTCIAILHRIEQRERRETGASSTPRGIVWYRRFKARRPVKAVAPADPHAETSVPPPGYQEP